MEKADKERISLNGTDKAERLAQGHSRGSNGHLSQPKWSDISWGYDDTGTHFLDLLSTCEPELWVWSLLVLELFISSYIEQEEMTAQNRVDLLNSSPAELDQGLENHGFDANSTNNLDGGDRPRRAVVQFMVDEKLREVVGVNNDQTNTYKAKGWVVFFKFC